MDHTHEDLWNYIDGLREDLGRAEARIADLEDKLAKRDEVLSGYGETLDSLRNRVYAVEHGTGKTWQAYGE